jgi:hypothetical protein
LAANQPRLRMVRKPSPVANRKAEGPQFHLDATLPSAPPLVATRLRYYVNETDWFNRSLMSIPLLKVYISIYDFTNSKHIGQNLNQLWTHEIYYPTLPVLLVMRKERDAS